MYLCITIIIFKSPKPFYTTLLTGVPSHLKYLTFTSNAFARLAAGVTISSSFAMVSAVTSTTWPMTMFVESFPVPSVSFAVVSVGTVACCCCPSFEVLPVALLFRFKICACSSTKMTSCVARCVSLEIFETVITVPISSDFNNSLITSPHRF